ncbi:cathepsin L-like [Glandiceps talaboti]
MKLVLCFALVAIAAAVSVDVEWEEWKTIHGKVYSQEEELTRRVKWHNNMKFIQLHNRDFANGNKNYGVAMNKFGDLDTEEYKKLMCGYRAQNRSKSGGSSFLAPSNVVLPDHIDWRDHGCVTAVKDQGSCGSCWAFSSTGSLECQYFKKTGQLISLSEQQLIDCSYTYGNMGCNGGWIDQAFAYIRDNGEMSEADYPYIGTDESPCRYETDRVVTSITNYFDLPSKHEYSLQEAVATVGTISVAIDASHQSFQFYSGPGVYDEPQCSEDNLDHAVLVVGYGSTDQGQDYWIVKNSWGNYWGIQGYILMSRNKNNQCGIATAASYPQI